MVENDIQRIVFFNFHYKLQISKVPQERLRYLIIVLVYFPFPNNNLLAAHRDNVLVIKLQHHLLDDPYLFITKTSINFIKIRKKEKSISCLN